MSQATEIGVDWVRVPLGPLGDDEMERVRVEGRDIAVYRSQGRLCATSNVCTHGAALLTDGWLEDGVIECPLHGGRFDVATGKGLGAPIDQDLACYALRETDGGIELAIPRAAS